MCQWTKTLHAGCGHIVPSRNHCAFFKDKKTNHLYELRDCPNFIEVQANAGGRCEKYGYCIPNRTMADDDDKYNGTNKSKAAGDDGSSSSVKKPEEKPDVTMS